MGKPTVMVVDDELGIRTLMQAILEEADCRPLLAGTPSQALRLADNDRPDMAIVDYMLPEMDGIGLGRQLRHRFGDSFPLLFMSAMPMPQAKLGQLSSYLFVAKPFDISSVLEAIQSALHPVQPRPLNLPARPEEAEDGERPARRPKVSSRAR